MKKVALIGNPNSGKSTLFNALTGLQQKISNYPGVTVEKKTGSITLQSGERVELIDFPGIYSMYPNSFEERIVVETLTNVTDENYPDCIVYTASTIDLEKHFLLVTQLKQLGMPLLVCLTMDDVARSKNIAFDLDYLSNYLDAPVISVSAQQRNGLDNFLSELAKLTQRGTPKAWNKAYALSPQESKIAKAIAGHFPSTSEYQALLIGHHSEWLKHIDDGAREQVISIVKQANFRPLKAQIEETMSRYNGFLPLLQQANISPENTTKSFSERVDNILTHKVFGPFIFFIIMLFTFQAIFSWAEWPMTQIENIFMGLSGWIHDLLPSGWFTDLLADGIIAGIGGVVVFIPQIAILFFLISILEESGYMSRVVFLFDEWLRRFGLNGRSVVALISGGACAIPAIMSTRTISNWKERLITIMVTPLISCSARLPVYVILIALIVPSRMLGGIISYKALAMMGLYLLGIVAALLSAWVFHRIIKSQQPSYLMLELPRYQFPQWQRVLVNVREKVWGFVWEAGKVILVVSIVLWFLASYGPTNQMQNAEVQAKTYISNNQLDDVEAADYVASQKLEASYAGHLGKLMEPVIKPLGYDWKIGIALLSSFAAREVFVGTMATIYSIGSAEEDPTTLREHMQRETHADTGKPVYTVASTVSLLLFYVFALQCMSTVAVTKRETNSWKWAGIQFGFMTVMAYVFALMSYQFLQ